MKKKILGLVAIALVAVTVGGTYAYLQAQSKEITNTFTMGEGITIEIAEPNWDKSLFKTGDNTVFENDPLFGTGIEAAKNFTPGLVIAKNPMVKNTSKSTPEYIAIKLSYGNVGSFEELSKFATVNFNTEKWTFNSDYTVAYFKGAVAADAITTPLFTSVTIKNDATVETMKNFEITVKGFACQTTNVEGGTDAVTTLNTVFGDTLTK